MKRVVNIILTLCIVVSMLAGFSLNAFAAEYIYEVTVDGIPTELEAGQNFSDIVVSAPEGANYRVETEWTTYDYDLESYVGVESGTVGDYGLYLLTVTYYPKDGYLFGEYYEVEKIFGEKDYDSWGLWEDEGFASFAYYVGYEAITEVEIVSIAAPVVGEMPSLDAVVLPEDAPYYINEEDSEWVLNDYGWESFDGAFEKGHDYELDLYLVPKEGYYFDEEATNVFPVEENYNVQKPDCVNYEFAFTTKDIISEVDIAGVAEIAAGNEFSLADITASENVVLDEIYFYRDGEDYEGEILAGSDYSLEFYASPAEGCTFTSDTVVTVNGEALSEDWFISVDTDGIYVSYSTRVTLPQIEKVEINNVPEAVVGENAVIGGVTVPEDANYTIEYVQWCDVSSDSCDVSVFENGHRYTINVRLIPLPGYEFADYVDVYVDGEYVGEDWSDVEYYDYYEEYSFYEKIDSVELPAFPEVEVGDEVSVVMPEPGDDGYGYGSVWLDLESEEYYEGALEEGKVYYFAYLVMPDEGYEFSEDTSIIVGDEEYESIMKMVTEEVIIVIKSYGFGVEFVDKIEVTIPEPAEGETPADIEDIIVPEDAAYEVTDLMWGVNSEDDSYNAEDMTGVFELGNYYFAGLDVELSENTYISSEIEVYVNGEKIEINAGNFYMKDVNVFSFVHSFGELKEEEVVPTPTPTPAPEQPEIPDTSDSTAMVLFAIVVMMAAAAGMIFLRRKEER